MPPGSFPHTSHTQSESHPMLDNSTLCSLEGLPHCKDTSHILFSTFIYPIYIVLFHLLPPYYLDVPCYLNNRQRYCSVWSEREGLFTPTHSNAVGNSHMSVQEH